MTVKIIVTFKVPEDFGDIASEFARMVDKPMFKMEAGDAATVSDIADLEMGSEVKLSYFVHTGKEFRLDQKILNDMFEKIGAEVRTDMVPPTPSELANSTLEPLGDPRPVIANYLRFADRIGQYRDIIEGLDPKGIITEAGFMPNEEPSVPAPFKP